MPLNRQKGNMYDWVTHTHTHIGGKCPHECVYCSIQDLARRFGESFRYSGALRLIEKEFDERYGRGKTIFMENCNDLFAEDVPDEWIERILEHCYRWPENTYVFQTKNPSRFFDFMNLIPAESYLGCTIETNRETVLANAPSRKKRAINMGRLLGRRFITIEPIMKFDLDEFAHLLILAQPHFVNIGADSKGHGLPEPTMNEVLALVERLKASGIEVRKKVNLERLNCK